MEYSLSTAILSLFFIVKFIKFPTKLLPALVVILQFTINMSLNSYSVEFLPNSFSADITILKQYISKLATCDIAVKVDDTLFYFNNVSIDQTAGESPTYLYINDIFRSGGGETTANFYNSNSTVWQSGLNWKDVFSNATVTLRYRDFDNNGGQTQILNLGDAVINEKYATTWNLLTNENIAKLNALVLDQTTSGTVEPTENNADVVAGITIALGTAMIVAGIFIIALVPVAGIILLIGGVFGVVLALLGNDVVINWVVSTFTRLVTAISTTVTQIIGTNPYLNILFWIVVVAIVVAGAFIIWKGIKTKTIKGGKNKGFNIKF
jgi:hypothetical protein